MAGKVTVYTSEQCPYCDRAKRLLKERGVAFDEVRIGWDDDQAWVELEARSGLKTVPQIFVDGKVLGGFTELSARDAQDGLASLRT